MFNKYKKELIFFIFIQTTSPVPPCRVGDLPFGNASRREAEAGQIGIGMLTFCLRIDNVARLASDRVVGRRYVKS